MKSHIALALDLEIDENKVIEIGLTEIDLKSRNILRTYSMPIKPSSYWASEPYFCWISEEVSILTGWTYGKLNKSGVTLAEACRRIQEKYGGLNRLLITDSDLETEALKRSVFKAHPAHYPFGDSTLNVSHLFSILFREFGSSIGLDEMLTRVGLTFEGRRHRASDDSRNIAKLLLRLTEMKMNG